MVIACLSTLLILFAQKSQSINVNAPSPPVKLEEQGVTSAKDPGEVYIQRQALQPTKTKLHTNSASLEWQTTTTSSLPLLLPNYGRCLR